MVAERLVVYAPAGGALSRIKQGHSLPGAFIFEKTKNEAKSLLRLISPRVPAAF